MPPIQAVLFDLGNTLSLSASLADSFARLAGGPLAAELGLDDAQMPALGKAIDQSIADLYKDDSTAQPHWLDVWRQPAARCGIALSPGDTERLCRAHLDHFVRSCAVAPHTVPLLTYLQEAGIPMALVSNVTGPVDIFQADLDRKGLIPFFKEIVWSSAVGFRKPDRRIFSMALDSLGLKAGPTIAMAGDSEAADITGGKAMGFTTIKVQKSARGPATEADYSATGAGILELFRSGIELRPRPR